MVNDEGKWLPDSQLQRFAAVRCSEISINELVSRCSAVGSSVAAEAGCG